MCVYSHTYKCASVWHVLTSVVATVVIMVMHLLISCPSIPLGQYMGNKGEFNSVLNEKCSPRVGNLISNFIKSPPYPQSRVGLSDYHDSTCSVS